MKISRIFRHTVILSAFILASTIGVYAATPVQNYFNKKGFAWGLDVASSIDLTGNSMTSIDIEGYFGYKNSFFQALGVGASVNMAMNNSSRSYPVFAIIRTSFSTRPQLCFFELKAGVSFNDIYSYTHQTGIYIEPAIGIRLASGRSWSSHFTLGYKFITRKDFAYDEGIYGCPNLSMASVGIGISF